MFVHDALLRKHVRESNLIEGITASPDMPEYKGHIVAARAAASGDFVEPNILHRLLTRPMTGFGSSSGAYRRVGVAVGARRMPHWREVPKLMDGWSSLVGEYFSSDNDLEYSAFFLHAWLLCIHPWIDGNGRTSRLVWNMLRLQKGLPWIVQSSRTKYGYYAQIRRVERVFEAKYPEVYWGGQRTR